MHTIQKILEVKNHQIKLQFDDDTIKWIDLEHKIKTKTTTRDSLYKPLLDEAYFKTVKLHPEWETIYWNNGIDFCPDTLYNLDITNDRN